MRQTGVNMAWRMRMRGWFQMEQDRSWRLQRPNQGSVESVLWGFEKTERGWEKGTGTCFGYSGGVPELRLLIGNGKGMA